MFKKVFFDNTTVFVCTACLSDSRGLIIIPLTNRSQTQAYYYVRNHILAFESYNLETIFFFLSANSTHLSP